MTALLDEHGTPKVKVLIAVPCGDQVAAGFAQDLALLMGFTTFAKPDMELALAFLRGTYLPPARPPPPPPRPRQADRRGELSDADGPDPPDRTGWRNTRADLRARRAGRGGVLRNGRDVDGHWCVPRAHEAVVRGGL